MRRQLLAFLLLSCALGVWANPFITPSGRTPSEQQEKGPATSPAGYAPRIPALIEGQRRLQERLASLMVEIREGRSPRALVVLLLIALVYGFLHALGPGHRKTVVISYFLQDDAKIGAGLGAGLAMAGLHGLSAITIVLVIYFLIRGSVMAIFENVTLVVEIISFAAIAVFGLVLLVLRVYEAVVGGRRNRGRESSSASRKRRATLTAMVVSAGIVPCPGAAMIMLFAISTNVVMVGVAASLVMSAGMAVTISLVSILTILTRDQALRFVSHRGRLEVVIQHGIEILGAALVAGFGLLMLSSYLFA